MTNVLVVIPARLASSRFPRKLLQDRTGKPLIQHTYEAAKSSRLATAVVVATEDEEIAHRVEGFGGRAVLTGPCATGTERVAEAARLMDPDPEIIINLQGDEPEMPGDYIDRLIQLMRVVVANEAGQYHRCEMATLATPTTGFDDLLKSNVVKIVTDQRRFALYFSRSLIPHFDSNRVGHADPALVSPWSVYFHHLGIYAYTAEFLRYFTGWPATPLERAEGLEQLRVLEHGWRIAVGLAPRAYPGIDTRTEYEAFVARYAAGNG